MIAVDGFEKLLFYCLTIFVFINSVFFLGVCFSEMIGFLKRRGLDQSNALFKEYFGIVKKLVELILFRLSRHGEFVQELYPVPFGGVFERLIHVITP